MSKRRLPNSITYRDTKNTNRAYEKRRDDDYIKTPEVTLYDIDYNILHFMRKEMGLEIQEVDTLVEVPVIYANGETWAQIQNNGYLRDNKGKLMTPIVSLRRMWMEENKSYVKMDTNRPADNRVYLRGVSRNLENSYDQHRKTYNSKPAQEYHITLIPEYYDVYYEVIIWTELQEQMNKVVEKIIPTSNFVWGDQLKFQTNVGEFEFETLNLSNQERLIKSRTILKVNGYITPAYNLRKSTVEKAFTIKRVVFKNERDEFDVNFLD